jgi:hypothetical protein
VIVTVNGTNLGSASRRHRHPQRQFFTGLLSRLYTLADESDTTVREGINANFFRRAPHFPGLLLQGGNEYDQSST